MQKGVQCFDSWNLDTDLLRKLDRRTKVGLYLHRPSRQEVLVHDAVCFRWYYHLLHRLFPKPGLEVTTLRCGRREQLVDDPCDHRPDAGLLEELGMRRSLKDYAGRMEGDWSNPFVSICSCFPLQHKAYPTIRSYCCCRMFVDTSHSTCPDFSVIASASAMSVCIDAGMDGFLFAAPTHSSVPPLCSNSLAPSCAISAPDTSDRTTLVGNRCSR